MADEPRLTGTGSEELPHMFDIELEVEADEGDEVICKVSTCNATRCMFNQNNKCTLDEITVGEDGGCEQFEPRKEAMSPYTMAEDSIPVPPAAIED